MKDLAITILPLLLATLLLFAAWSDIRSRTIPESANIGIALLAMPWWWASDYSLWPGVPIQLAITAIVFLPLALLFALNAMGGGDVKLLTTLSLWMTPIPLVTMLTIMALIGGVLTLGFAITHWIRKSPGRPEVPYGVAIALAGVLTFGERYLNHFG